MTKKILIVEDDKDIRMVLAELLEDAGYVVQSAVNGQVALDILNADPVFDLILLDLMMPGMNGFEFRERQKVDPRIAKIPVVVMSADGQIRQKMLRADVSEYLKKPVDMDPFLETVARMVGT